MVFGITLLVIMAVALFFVLRPSKAEKQQQEELEERLKDDRLYDPLSGKYITLEEAENGIVHTEDVFDRIKSDEEIEENYTEDQREVEYIIRDMIQAGIREPEDDRIYELVNYSKIFDSYNSCHVNYLWEIKPDHFLGVAHVTYIHQHGRDQVAGSESQLFGIIQGKLNVELSKRGELEFIELGNTHVFRLAKKLKHEDFREIFHLIS